MAYAVALFQCFSRIITRLVVIVAHILYHERYLFFANKLFGGSSSRNIWNCFIDSSMYIVFSTEKGIPVFWKRCSVSRKFVESLNIDIIENFQWLLHKSMPISQIECYFENPYYRFLAKTLPFLLALKWTSRESAFLR